MAIIVKYYWQLKHFSEKTMLDKKKSQIFGIWHFEKSDASVAQFRKFQNFSNLEEDINFPEPVENLILH